MIFSVFFWLCSSRGRSHSCSHPSSTNYCVCDGQCTHTHLLHVHLLVYIHCAYTSHILMRVTHMHGSRVSAVRMSCLPWLTFSLLMFHPSLLMSSLLFLDGHFETTPDCDLTDFDVHDFPQNFPDLKAQVKRTPNEDELSGYLAKSAFNRRLWAQEVRQDHICGQWHDAHWRSRPRYLRLFENHRRNIGQFGVSAEFEFSVSHVFHWWFCFSERKQRKHATGKQLLDREKEKKEKVLWSVLQGWCQWKVDGTELGVISTHRSILMIEISEYTWSEELNKLVLVKIQLRKKILDWDTTRRSKIRNEEIQNTQYLSHNENMNLKEDISCADQAQCERIHSWS